MMLCLECLGVLGVGLRAGEEGGVLHRIQEKQRETNKTKGARETKPNKGRE